MGDCDIHWSEGYAEAEYGDVRLDGGRIVVERTDVEPHPVTGELQRVTEWVPVHWLINHLPADQAQALKAIEAGFETAPCPHEEGTCEACQDRQLRELVAAYRQAVPWWDQSSSGVSRRIRRDGTS